jgi:hypothetical protein
MMIGQICGTQDHTRVNFTLPMVDDFLSSDWRVCWIDYKENFFTWIEDVFTVILVRIVLNSAPELTFWDYPKPLVYLYRTRKPATRPRKENVGVCLLNKKVSTRILTRRGMI